MAVSLASMRRASSKADTVSSYTVLPLRLLSSCFQIANGVTFRQNNLPFLNFLFSRQHTKQGGLACAVLPHQSNPFPFPEGAADTLKKWSGRQNAGSDSESRSCCKGIAEIWVDLSVSQIVRLCRSSFYSAVSRATGKNNNREWFQSNRKTMKLPGSMCWRSLPPYWMACLHSTRIGCC